MESKFTTQNHLQALRSIHKLNKLKKNSKKSEEKKSNPVIEEISEPLTGFSVQGSSSKSPISPSKIKNLNKRIKKSGSIENSKIEKSSSRKRKSDIAVTLEAYNVHLKKVEDKHYFNLRQEFSRSLAKLGSLDTRDIVKSNFFSKKFLFLKNFPFSF